MRSGLLAARRAQLFCLGLSVFAAACAPELEKLKDERSTRGSLGQEVYKTLCRRLAGTELVDDLDGRETEDLCLGDKSTAERAFEDMRDELPPRLLALAERRERIVNAIDATLPDELGDELENLMRELLPFYDAPEERIQTSTRTLAAFLTQLSGDKQALLGLERLGRVGMLPAEHSYGAYRAMLGYSDVSKVLSVLLPILTEDKEVKPAFALMLTGLALELATSEVDDDPDSSARVLKDLLVRTHPDFGQGKPLFTAKRDARGLPMPAPVNSQAVPYPFVDANDDQLADEEAGRFVLADGFKGPLPEPFATRDEAAGTARDETGRAYGFDKSGKSTTDALYDTLDANNTVLAASLRESGKLFAPDTQIAKKLAEVFPVLFGERVESSREFGKLSFKYTGPNTDDSPLIDIVHALGSTVDRSIYPESLELTQRLFEDNEAAQVRALQPLLTLEKRTRAESDAYPKAKLADATIFWDELLFEVEKLSRMRRDGTGDTALESMMRGTLGYVRDLSKPGQPLVRSPNYAALKHQGAVAATLMRFKDEWRGNPRTESKRSAGEPGILGAFKTPVDRTKPDSPVTCGKDGCGGLVAGTPFAMWAEPGQTCMTQRGGRVGTDCGAAANQSIYHRSLGLIWEMAGRAQCNKVITVGNLLASTVFKDPCSSPKAVINCVGATPAEKDSFCATQDLAPDSSADNPLDNDCDDTRGICIVNKSRDSTPGDGQPGSCNALKLELEANRDQTILDTEAALDKSYTCSSNPSDPCFDEKYPAAFLDADGPGVGQEAAIQACHLMDLPDVGRTFGRALSSEFKIEIPNPWVRRYLEDVARARNTSLPTCEPYSVKNPEQIPTCSIDDGVGDTCALGAACLPEASVLSRSVYQEDLDDYEARYGTEVDTLGELIEFLLDDRALFPDDQSTADLRPDVKALSRVLFAPASSSSFLVFDPLLIKGAPPVCTLAEVQASKQCPPDDTAAEPAGCCIKLFDDKLKPTNPPLRYRLDTYYGATTFSWEQDLTFTDGTKLSFIDSTKALADAINRVDYRPENGDDPKNFENIDYVFSTIGKMVAQHYDSPDNPGVQNKDPNGPMFRYLTNLVSYEEMLADLLDDGMIVDGPDDFISLTDFTDPQQRLGLLYNSFDVIEALDAMDFGGARDGIDVAADLAEHLLSPHVGCAGPSGDRRVIDGKGACDLEAAGQSGLVAPLTYRDGTASICWNDGTCFDGKQGRALRYATPIYMLLDAVKKIDDRITADPKVDAAFDAARAGIIDTYAAIEDDELVDRKLRALLIVGAQFMRDRWAEKESAGELSQLRDDLTADAIDLVGSPLFAGGLNMLEGLLAKPDALDELTRFSYALLSDSEGTENVRSLLAALADLVQTLPGDANTNALLRLLSESIAPGIGEVLAEGKGTPALEASVLWQNLTLSRDTVAKDKKNTLADVFNNVVSSTTALPYTPLETFLDSVTSVNRADPTQKGVLSAEDWGSVAEKLTEIMLDERRGLERLYDLVQCRNESTDVCE